MKYIKLISIFIYIQTFAQSPQQNFQKYWNYRQRLNDKFMIVSSGNEKGTNIPASARHNSNEGQFFENTLSFGDATIELSYYIAVLATEYRLLKDYGQPYDNTLKELAYALLALERLDNTAEEHYRIVLNSPVYCLPYEYDCGDGTICNGLACEYHETNDLNGFFIRDDVDYNFAKDWKSVKPFFVETQKIKSDFTMGLKYDESGNYIEIDPTVDVNDYRHAEMSQDQVWNLVTAFAITKKLVDDQTYFTDIKGNNKTIRQWVMILTERILKYMKVTDCAKIFGETVCSVYWGIQNPVPGEIVHRGGGTGDLYFFSGLFSHVGSEICEKEIHNSQIESNWVYPTPLGNYWSDHGQLLLNACLNSTDFDSYQYIYQMTDQYSSDFEFTFEHAPLINLLMYKNNDNLYVSNALDGYIEDLLNQAPQNGPFNFGNPAAPDFSQRWSAPSEYANPMQTLETYNSWWGGEFNGLDYMLLHNLYWLTFIEKQPLNDTIPYSTFPWPLGSSIGFGSKTNPRVYNSVNKAYVSAYFNNYADVTINAGGSIVLKNGTKFDDGAHFLGQITGSSGMKNYPDFINTGYNYWCYNTTKKSGKIHEEENAVFTSNFDSPQQKILKSEKSSFSYSFSIAPNPFKNTFSVITDQTELTIVEIYNSSGLLLKKERFKNRKEIDMSGYPQGIYLVKSIFGNNVVSKQVVKM